MHPAWAALADEWGPSLILSAGMVMQHVPLLACAVFAPTRIPFVAVCAGAQWSWLKIWIAAGGAWDWTVQMFASVACFVLLAMLFMRLRQKAPSRNGDWGRRTRYAEQASLQVQHLVRPHEVPLQQRARKPSHDAAVTQTPQLHVKPQQPSAQALAPAQADAAAHMGETKECHQLQVGTAPASASASAAGSVGATTDGVAAEASLSSRFVDSATGVVAEPDSVKPGDGIPEEPDTLAGLATQLDQALALYSDDRFVESNQLLVDTEAALRQHARQGEEEHRLASALLRRCQSEEFRRVRDIGQELPALMSSIRRLHEWNEVGNSDGIRTYYKHQEGSPCHSFAVFGDVNAPIFNVLSCLYEVDMLHTWMPGLTKSRRVATLTKFRMLGELGFAMPWPLANRRTTIVGYGDLIDDGVGIFMKSWAPGQDIGGHVCPPPPSGDVDVTMNFGVFHVKSVDANTTQVKAIFNFDPHLAVVPYSMLNMVSRKFCFFFIKFMRSNVKRFIGPEYRRIIQDNWAVYGEIQRRLKEAGMPCADFHFDK